MTAKRRFFGVMAFLSITALVFIAGIVVVAAAQDNEEKLTFTERVAAILGIETQKVEDAIEQAKAEIATERRESFKDDLLEKGVFTEEEVEELFDEWTDKSKFYGPFGWSDEWDDEHHSFRKIPFGKYRYGKDSEDLDGIEEKHSFSFVMPSRGKFHAGEGDGDLTDWIDRLVEQGVMNQEDADAIKELLEDGFPSSLEGIMPEFSDGERKFEFDSDDGRFRFRGHWKWNGWEDDDSSEEDDAENDDISFAAQF